MRGQFWSFLQCFFCVRPIFVTLVRTPVDFCPEAHVERQERVEHEVCVEHEARVEREVHVECEACVQLGQVGIWWLIFVTLYFSYPTKGVPSAKHWSIPIHQGEADFLSCFHAITVGCQLKRVYIFWICMTGGMF